MESNRNRRRPAVSEKKSIYFSPLKTPNRQRDIEAKKKLKVQQNRTTFIQYDDNTPDEPKEEETKDK